MENHRFFSFYVRDGVQYVRFRNPHSKRYGSGRSTGFTLRADAEFAVRAYLEGLRPSFTKAPSLREPQVGATGRFLLEDFFASLRTLPLQDADVRRLRRILEERGLSGSASPSSRPLVPFLESFWHYDQSAYVQGMLNKGHRISRRHCYDQTKHVQNHWQSFFGERGLDEIRLADLEGFCQGLKAKGLTGKSINNVLNAGVVAFHWAAERKMIAEDPSIGLGKFAVKNQARGVLTPEEVNTLFTLSWPDERARVGNLLACTCGLRSGEVLALRVGDLGTENGALFVARSWNRLDLFTDPKWGSFRDASLPQPIRETLLSIAHSSPFPVAPDLLIFHGTSPDRPRDGKYLLDALKQMLLELNPDPEYWKRRRVDFHSWRHYFTSRMSEMLDDPTLMKATGHKTKDAFDEYANHLTPEQLERVRTAQTDPFAGLA